jgi:serine/threonine-protein kinase
MAERFTLLSELGRGGMGVVWKARDTETGQIVALKLLRAAYSEDPDYVARFERELELAKRIHSQNVVQVLGYGVRDGTPYLSLEFVDGPSLREILKAHGPYSWPEARQVLTQLAEGLADAHATGVIHRDMKPSNVLVGPDGVAKIADFGIAKGLDLTRVTGTSTLLGTPAYLPPEGPADQRSDLYSLGVIAYEIMTGVVPFEGRTYQDVILAHVRTPPNLDRLPPEARPIIGWLLAKDPAARPQTARRLIRALSGPETIPPRPEGEAARAAEGIAPYYAQTPRGGSDSGRALPRWDSPATGRPRWLPAAGAVTAIVVVVALVVVTAAWAGGSRPPVASPTSTEPLEAATSAIGAVDPTLSADASATGGQAAAAAASVGQWFGFGSLPADLWGNGVAQLATGKVAIFSACVNSTCNTATKNTWVLDPQTGAINAGAPMAWSQLNPAVAVFNNGADVMIAGGRSNGDPIGVAEILDLTTGTFRAVPSMAAIRDQASATDIGNGRVLVAGGWISKSSRKSGSNIPTASAEIFDINTMKWSPAAPMSTARALAIATNLSDGRVLMAGGDHTWTGGSFAPNKQQVLTSAEIYDPATDTWQGAGNMSTPRAASSASLLPNGHILVVGGWSDGHEYAQISTDEYTPGSGWRTGAMPGAHAMNRQVQLKDGRVMVVGGADANGNVTSESDLFDPVSGIWQRTGDLKQSVRWSAVVALVDGRVLLVGGLTAKNNISQIEVYQP